MKFHHLLLIIVINMLQIFFNTPLRCEMGLTIETLYGTEYITEPVIIDLIKSTAFQRLLHIHQYGISYYLQKEPYYSRYEHSIGVFMLTRRYGAPLEEQIAALLHDVSHTPFSHLGDFMFKHHSLTESYQDSIHIWFLYQTEIPTILAQYGFCADDLGSHKKSYRCLEQDLPDLCADRIEYLLKGGFLEGHLTVLDISNILESLCYKDGVWFFNNTQRAEQLARISLVLTKDIFASPRNWFINTLGAKIILKALEIGIIKTTDLNFATDEFIWQRLVSAQNLTIKELMLILKESQYDMKCVDQNQEYDICIYPKFRGIDPLVETHDGIKKLSDISSGYAAAYYALKQSFIRGLCMRFDNRSLIKIFE